MPLSPEIVCYCQGFFQGSDLQASGLPGPPAFARFPVRRSLAFPGLSASRLLPGALPRSPHPENRTTLGRNKVFPVRFVPRASFIPASSLSLSSRLRFASQSLLFPWSQSFKSLRPGSSASSLTSLSLRFTLPLPCLVRSSPRPISIVKLHALQRFHRRPITSSSLRGLTSFSEWESSS